MSKQSKIRKNKLNSTITRYTHKRRSRVLVEITYFRLNQMVESGRIELLDKNFTLPTTGSVKVVGMSVGCVSGTGLLPNRPPVRQIVIATQDGRKCRGVIKVQTIKPQ